MSESAATPSYWPNWAGVLTLDPIPGLDPGVSFCNTCLSGDVEVSRV